jgi:propanol-preferring alcohol dehydrogenase
MTRKMQAAQVDQFGQPLVLKELDIPTPGAGQILVKTAACGVCHTDLNAAGGDWPLKPALPFTPGHEGIGIGIVTALGAGVTAVKEGDRVGVPWLHSACGHCEKWLAGAQFIAAVLSVIAGLSCFLAEAYTATHASHIDVLGFER